jgi:hypothetical protein
MSDERTREKLANAITVKVDDVTLAQIDEQQRLLETKTDIPLTRAVFLRILIAEALRARG